MINQRYIIIFTLRQELLKRVLACIVKKCLSRVIKYTQTTYQVSWKIIQWNVCTSQYFYEKSEITYFSVKVQWKLHQDDSLINKSPKTFPNRVFYILRLRKNKNFIKIYRKDPSGNFIKIYRKDQSGKRIYMEVIDTDRNSIPDAVVETTVLRYNTKSVYRQLWHTSGKYNSFTVLLSHWILIRFFHWSVVKNCSPAPQWIWNNHFDKGEKSFKNHVYMILLFFDQPPTTMDIFFAITMDKNNDF